MSHNRAPFYVSSEGILNGLCPAGSYAVTKWRPLSPLPRFGRKPGAWEKCQRDRGRLDETKGARSLLGFFDRIDSPRRSLPGRSLLDLLDASKSADRLPRSHFARGAELERLRHTTMRLQEALTSGAGDALGLEHEVHVS